jgi:hypothetical protein
MNMLRSSQMPCAPAGDVPFLRLGSYFYCQCAGALCVGGREKTFFQPPYERAKSEKAVLAFVSGLMGFDKGEKQNL